MPLVLHAVVVVGDPVFVSRVHLIVPLPPATRGALVPSPPTAVLQVIIIYHPSGVVVVALFQFT